MILSIFILKRITARMLPGGFPSLMVLKVREGTPNTNLSVFILEKVA